MESIEKDSFVVISDFHSYGWPLKKVEEYYLKEYDKIYILGDATDRGPYGRGEGGIDLLLRIKKLTEQYPDRVIYIPGNHDEFLYGYAADRDSRSERGLRINHGSETIYEFDRLTKREKDDLTTWLGNLPLQSEHFYREKRYVLAHALFDQKTYEKDPNFSIKKYRSYGGNHGIYSNIIWFRKGSDQNDPSSLPKKGTTMIIGHTPSCYRTGVNLDLKNASGDIIRVICVDGGIAYEGEMLKYSAADGKCGVYSTEHYVHVNRGCKQHPSNPKTKNKQSSSNKTPSNKAELDESIKKIIDSYILRLIWTEKSVDKAIDIVLNKTQTNLKEYIEYKNKYIRISDIKEYFEEIILSYLEKHYGEREDALKIHFIEVCIDYVSKLQLQKFETLDAAYDQMDAYLDESQSEKEGLQYIRSEHGTRKLMEIIGRENVYYWLHNNNYLSYKDYLTEKFGKQYCKKS